jgi:hypothetical protein
MMIPMVLSMSRKSLEMKLRGWARKMATSVLARYAEGDRDPPDETFCRTMPSAQTAIDIFAGQWSCELPPPLEGLTGGAKGLFDDGRITWGIEALGEIGGRRILELGPLEGAHTSMLDRLGATEIVSIEANRRAFLRCLVVKELVGMPHAKFLCGDFQEFLKDAVGRGARWDLCVAIGVLYHQQDPVHLLELATQVSDQLLLWTHFYDPDFLASHPERAATFAPGHEQSTAGFRHTLHRHNYGPSVGDPSFCGGINTWTSWMSRDDILGALAHFNFEVADSKFYDDDQVNGPSISIAARRKPD